MENKKSFILYQEYEENIADLSQKQKGDLLDAIFAYSHGHLIELEPLVKMAFSFIKADLDRSGKAWKKTREERSLSGRIGNLKRWNLDLHQQYQAGKITLEDAENIAKHRKTSLSDNSESLKSQEIANIAVNVNEDVNVNVNVNEDVKKKRGERKNFKKPTLEEIRTYCNSIAANINPETFYNHYETNGWKVGKNSMKDWQAAIKGWNSREKDKIYKQPLTKTDQAMLKTWQAGQNLIKKYNQNDIKN